MKNNILKKYSEKKGGFSFIPYFTMNAPWYPTPKLGDVGLELELEGRNLLNEGYLDKVKGPKSGVIWLSKTDGSLRNGGREYVLSEPCLVDEVGPLLTGLFGEFERNKTIVNNSNRCSTHVHLNMTTAKVNELTSVIGLWKVFEECLIRWCGIERTVNHFCLSSFDETGTVEAWTTFLRTGEKKWNAGLKYSALNILTLVKYGSFEVRCGPAANDAVTPIKWATFLHYFAKYARATYTNPSDIARDLSERGGLEIFKRICESADDDLVKEDFYKEVLANYQNNDEFNTACMKGFRNAQPFLLGFPWEDWLPEIQKTYVPDPFKKGKAKKISIAEAFPVEINRIERHAPRVRGFGDPIVPQQPGW